MNTKSKKKGSEDNEEVMDYRAILYAESVKSELIDEKWKKTWHLCRCAKCKQQMSIAQASWDENYAPIHKVCPPIKGE